MLIFKIFSKKLTKTDVENRLSLTTESLSSFPPFGEHQNYLDIMVDDDEGHKWPFRLVVRRGRFRKPVLSAGWLRFVRTKQLQSGHKVTFYRKQDEIAGQVKYKVKLKKPYIVFKAKLGYVSHCPAA